MKAIGVPSGGRRQFVIRFCCLALQNLQSIPTGVLESRLREAVSIGSAHIRLCPLCSLKGFICELCGHEKIVYPFDDGVQQVSPLVLLFGCLGSQE